MSIVNHIRKGLPASNPKIISFMHKSIFIQGKTILGISAHYLSPTEKHLRTRLRCENLAHGEDLQPAFRREIPPLTSPRGTLEVIPTIRAPHSQSSARRANKFILLKQSFCFARRRTIVFWQSLIPTFALMVIHHKPSLKACKKSEHLVTKLAILAFLVHKIGQLVKWNVKITVMLT